MNDHDAAVAAWTEWLQRMDTLASAAAAALDGADISTDIVPPLPTHPVPLELEPQVTAAIAQVPRTLETLLRARAAVGKRLTKASAWTEPRPAIPLDFI